MKEPSATFLECLTSVILGIEVDVSHIPGPGETNVQADQLSRWDYTDDPLANFSDRFFVAIK